MEQLQELLGQLAVMPTSDVEKLLQQLNGITARNRTEQALARERDLLKAIVSKSGKAHLAYLDCSFHFVRVNETYATACGHTPEEMIGKDFFTLCSHPRNEAIFARVGDTGEPVEFRDEPFEYADQPQRGVTYWDGTLIPVKDSAGHVTGLVLSLFETTARNQAEHALRDTQERLALAQRAGRVGVFDWDLVTNAAVWTPELEEIFGLPPGGFEHRYEGWRKRVHPDDLPRIEAMFTAWLRSDRTEAEWEYRYQRHGEVRWMAARGVVCRDATGKPLRMLGTNLDITERKEVEAALRQEKETYQTLAENLPGLVYRFHLSQRRQVGFRLCPDRTDGVHGSRSDCG